METTIRKIEIRRIEPGKYILEDHNVKIYKPYVLITKNEKYEMWEVKGYGLRFKKLKQAKKHALDNFDELWKLQEEEDSKAILCMGCPNEVEEEGTFCLDCEEDLQERAQKEKCKHCENKREYESETCWQCQLAISQEKKEFEKELEVSEEPVQEKKITLSQRYQELKKEVESVKEQMKEFVKESYEEVSAKVTNRNLHPKSNGKAVHRVIKDHIVSDNAVFEVYQAVSKIVGEKEIVVKESAKIENKEPELVYDHPRPSSSALDEEGNKLTVFGFFIRKQKRNMKNIKGETVPYFRWIASKSFRISKEEKKQVTVTLGKILPHTEHIEFRIKRYLRERPEIHYLFEDVLDIEKILADPQLTASS